MYRGVHGRPKLKGSTIKATKVFTVFLQLPNVAYPRDAIAAAATLG